MISGLKTLNRRACIIALTIAGCLGLTAAETDTIPSGFARNPRWSIGAEATPAHVFATNGFFRGWNPDEKKINSSFSGGLRAGFSFSPESREGILYPGTYQGLGVDIHRFFSGKPLGSPVSVFVYQEAPVAEFSDRLWLGYEWKFGAAMGWRHLTGQDAIDYTVPVSTSVTARMSMALKLHYRLSDRWSLSAGVEATHFSNGNTSLPNNGVNTLGAAVGLAYTINPMPQRPVSRPALEAEADRGRWFYDIVAYGAWRRRIVTVTDAPTLCPGKFGVAGFQFSPMRQFNRMFAAGAALDLQFDESAGLAPYWVEGTYQDGIKFRRPPFGKQISAGLSAHAELIMPIFALNAGIGYDFITPKGDKSFYQSLTLKTFVTRKVFLNVGYRLGNFKDPQNLMLGLGVRL